MKFQNGCKKNLSSNELTIVTAHEILVEEAPEVSTIPETTEDHVEKQKGYYPRRSSDLLSVASPRIQLRLLLLILNFVLCFKL